MKISSYILFFGILSVLSLTACRDKKNKSLSDLKKDQTTAIERLVSQQKLVVEKLKDNELPTTIDKGVYYRLKNGLYIRVLDEGDKSQVAKLNETTVFAYVKGYQFKHDAPKVAAFDNISSPSVPEIEFKYVYYYNAGDVHYNLVANTRPIRSYDALMCQGLAFPLSLKGIGNGARLSLIIPFEIGPSGGYSSGLSTFVEEVRYIFK